MPALFSVEIKILRQLTKLRRLQGQYSKQLSETGLFLLFCTFVYIVSFIQKHYYTLKYIEVCIRIVKIMSISVYKINPVTCTKIRISLLISR